LLWSITAALAGFLFGFDTVVISGAEKTIQWLWYLSPVMHGIAMGAALYGTVLGALLGGWPTDRFGRKATLLLIGVFYVVGAVGSALATDVYSFIIVRVIGGLGIGISTVVAPLYISEISPPKYRGRLAGMFQFNIVFGILVALLSNYLLLGIGANRPSTFSGNDLKDLTGFVTKVRQQSDPVSALLWQNLSNPEQVMLTNYQPTTPSSSQAQDVVLQALNRIIGEPSIYESASSPFSVDEIKDLSKLVNRLRNRSDAVSSFLWQKLSKQEQLLLANYQPSAPSSKQVQDSVVQALNRVIGEPSIYEPERFKGILLASETAGLMQQSQKDANLMRLNRLLLEDAFPLELAKNHETNRFKAIPLRPATFDRLKEALKHAPTGPDLARLNRMLLEDTYRMEFVRIGGNIWRWMLGVAAFPSLIYALLCFGLPESPRWLLVRKGNREEGLKVLRLIEPEAPQSEIEAEADGIVAASSEKVTASRFWTWRLRIPILLAILIAFFNQLSGINAILYYAPRIFEMAGLTEKAAVLQSVGIGVTNFLFTFVGLYLIDRLGRRTLLYIGSFGYIISLSLVAWAFFTAHYSFVPVCIFAFIAAHAVGQGAVIWVFIAEIFPNRHRAEGQALGCGTHWVFCALLASFFPKMADVFKGQPGYIFAFFAGMMVLQLIWVATMVPETKGVPLEQMQKQLGVADA
jgi:MFS family permease